MNRTRVLLFLALTVILVAYFATGLHMIAPGEAAVVRRCGQALRQPWGPGLRLGLPWGFDVVERVRTDEVRRIDVGPSEALRPGDEPGAGEFLTGDLNFVRARASLQYRVADAVAFSLRAASLDAILRRMTEASLARAISSRGIDAAIRQGRSLIAREAGAELAKSCRELGLGVEILGLSLTDARPPLEVAPDFAAAQSAQSERERRVNEAKALAATTVRAAEASALARLEQARGAADRHVALARSKSRTFAALLDEANKDRRPTVRRLYLDALRGLLPRVKRKLVLTPDEPLDLTIFGDAGNR